MFPADHVLAEFLASRAIAEYVPVVADAHARYARVLDINLAEHVAGDRAAAFAGERRADRRRRRHAHSYGIPRHLHGRSRARFSRGARRDRAAAAASLLPASSSS